jgi:hypothetical protein
MMILLVASISQFLSSSIAKFALKKGVLALLIFLLFK